MEIEFDPEKDRRNLEKRDISLARAVDFEILAFIEDTRFDYGETRYRAWGLLDGVYHALAFTMRGDRARVIMLRRAHEKEIGRYVASRS
ncbi:BrnT family toxin [Oceaniradius stylonematis]|uniref:BrnT family toxin n=1 Tax=Oceaniradius stylonematis TaxID=2184161 RepID=UPI00273E573B|nr:BrnT family toxin [Oceaniradius stylonematis]